jgi:hypothetical protein
MLPTIHEEETSYATTKTDDDEATARMSQIDHENKTTKENGHIDPAPRDKGGAPLASI